ncbi:MAG: allophanate hydrolase, partial [Betaproteobacteria bacterium]
MPDYSLDLTRLAEAYAQGRLTPQAVADDIYTAIAAAADNPLWIYVVPPQQMTAQIAALALRRAAGEPLPLYGIPFAVKDNIDVAGCPTTAACPAYAYLPQTTAFAVRRLQDAGALLFGKTNLDQFATGLVGTRSPYGACFNAFNRDYISGGSSSGSAVAVATGLVSFGLGTDTAGSGRVPAGFNNIVGLKPTPGIISTSGVVPACRSLDCVSVFALTCADASRVMQVMRGFDADDVYARCDTGERARRQRSAAHFRCGVPAAAQREFFGDAHAQVAFEQSLANLREIGAELVEIDFQPFLDVACLLYQGPWVAERYAGIRTFLEAQPEALHPVTRQVIESARQWSAVDTFEAIYALQALKRRCAAQWAQMDVLAVPTSGTIYTQDQVAAAPVQRNTDLGYYTNFVNLLDLCALAVPGPFRADGLPAGITLIAEAFGDRYLAEIGPRFHRASAVPLGATRFQLPAGTLPAATDPADHVLIVVVGAHLSGLPLNGQLTTRGATLVGPTQTAAQYRLYALPGMPPARPGLVRVASGGAAIDVELWAMPAAAVGAFLADVPPPLAIGTLRLADGREVKGFLCEACAVADARDITAFGGWRRYLAAGAGG